MRHKSRCAHARTHARTHTYRHHTHTDQVVVFPAVRDLPLVPLGVQRDLVQRVTQSRPRQHQRAQTQQHSGKTAARGHVNNLMNKLCNSMVTGKIQWQMPMRYWPSIIPMNIHVKTLKYRVSYERHNAHKCDFCVGLLSTFYQPVGLCGSEERTLRGSYGVWSEAALHLLCIKFPRINLYLLRSCNCYLAYANIAYLMSLFASYQSGEIPRVPHAHTQNGILLLRNIPEVWAFPWGAV